MPGSPVVDSTLSLPSPQQYQLSSLTAEHCAEMASVSCFSGQAEHSISRLGEVLSRTARPCVHVSFERHKGHWHAGCRDGMETALHSQLHSKQVQLSFICWV
jgi:hypothetical protein